MTSDRVTLDTLKAHALTLVSIRAGQVAWTPKAVLAALVKAADTISGDPELLIRASTRAALMDHDGPRRILKPSVIAMPGLHWESAYGSPLNADGTLAGPSTKVRRCDDCHRVHAGPAPECCPPREEDVRTAEDADFRRLAEEAIRSGDEPAEPPLSNLDTYDADLPGDVQTMIDQGRIDDHHLPQGTQ